MNAATKTTMANVRYWKRETEAWLDAHVHGKDVDDIVGIAGDVVITLGDDWDQSDVQAIRDGLADWDVPVYATRGTDQVRIDATDDRLPAPLHDPR